MLRYTHPDCSLWTLKVEEPSPEVARAAKRPKHRHKVAEIAEDYVPRDLPGCCPASTSTYVCRVGSATCAPQHACTTLFPQRWEGRTALSVASSGAQAAEAVFLCWVSLQPQHARLCADSATLPPLPVPNLGYCCLNVTLRNQKPQVCLRFVAMSDSCPLATCRSGLQPATPTNPLTSCNADSIPPLSCSEAMH